MADLITADYAKSQLGRISTADQARIPALVKAASEIVRQHCRSLLLAGDYREVLLSDFDGAFRLSHRPVIRIERLARSEQAVLAVQNTTADRAFARVRLAGDFAVPGGTYPDALVLTRVNSGTGVTSTLTFDSYPTLGLLSAAIVALGNGWTAAAMPGYSGWPAIDLSPQETLAATKECRFMMYVTDLDRIRIDGQTACIETDVPGEPIYVAYRAGFEILPEILKQATATVVGCLLKMGEGATTLGSGIVSRSLADRSISFSETGSANAIKTALASIPSQYRNTNRFTSI